MKNLSIIILYSKKYFKNNLMVLDEILKKYDTELVIVGNENVLEDIPYKYEYKNLDANDGDFKNNLISSCSSTKVMIIDCGLVLTEDFIAFVMDNLCKETCLNIASQIKTFLSKDSSEYFIHDEVILYNKGVKGFNNNYQKEELLDYSYMECNYKNIDLYIKNLIEKSSYNELSTWFLNYIERLNSKERAFCYSSLEKIKAENSKIDWQEINNIFIKKDKESKYTNYLLCRKNKNNIKRVFKACDALDKYYSWLVKDLIVANSNSLANLSEIPEKTIKECILYLLENDKDSWNYIHSFVLGNEKHLMELDIKYSLFDAKSKQIKKEASAFTSLVVITIEYMNNHITNPSTKKILLDIFSKYITLSKKLIELNLINGNSSVINVRNEKELIKDLSKDEGENVEAYINKINKLCNKHKGKVNTLRYFIQKIRFENNEYKKPLSICLIVKDEEKNIRRCLSSLRPLLNDNIAELIVVDTGSSDNTAKIAKEFTSKVYFHKWENNFSTARNQSLMYCDGEYSFIMDADEEISEADIELIKDEFSKEDYKNYDTLTLNIVSYTDSKLKYYAVMPQPRIFRNDCKFHYSSSVHNQAVCTPPVKNLDIDILHYGYIMTPDVREKKYQRTVTLLKKELLKNPRSIYFNYQLSSSYAMYGDMKAALKQVELYMQLISETDDLYDSVLMYYNNSAAIYINSFMYDKANAVCDKALKIAPDFIDFNYYKASILFENRDYKNALTYIEKYLSLISNYSEIEVANDGRFAFYTLCSHEEVKRLLLKTHYSLGMYEACITDINSLQDEGMIISCLYEFISSCEKCENVQALDEFYNKVTLENEREVFINIFKYFKDVIFNKAPTDGFYKLPHYSFDTLDFDSFYVFAEDIITEMIDLDAEKISDKDKLIEYKKILQLIIHRTEDLRYYYLSDEELVDIFNKYMFICSKLTAEKNVECLEIREVMFINKILQAYKAKTTIEAKELFHDAVIEYTLMNGIVNLTLEILFEDELNEVFTSKLQENDITKDNDLAVEIPRQYEIANNDKNNLKVLHGTLDNTEAISLAVAALKKKNFKADSLNYIPRKSKGICDYEMDVNSFENGKVILDRTIEACSYLIPRYDIFHFYHGTSIIFNHDDIAITKKLKKKIVVQLSGEEIRTSLTASEINPYLKLSQDKDEGIISKLTKYSSYASCCIVDDYEVYEHAKNYFDKVFVIEPFVKIEKNTKVSTNSKFTIVHAPISRKTSGTEEIIKVLDELKEFYDIDYVILDNQPMDEIKEAFSNADLIIDGILTGTLSKYGLEAMALSRPVICYISDFMKTRYPSELPIIQTKMESLKGDIENILKDKSKLDDIGKASKAYAIKYHNEDIYTEKLIEIYKNLE